MSLCSQSVWLGLAHFFSYLLFVQRTHANFECVCGGSATQRQHFSLASIANAHNLLLRWRIHLSLSHTRTRTRTHFTCTERKCNPSPRLPKEKLCVFELHVCFKPLLVFFFRRKHHIVFTAARSPLSSFKKGPGAPWNRAKTSYLLLQFTEKNYKGRLSLLACRKAHNHQHHSEPAMPRPIANPLPSSISTTIPVPRS